MRLKILLGILIPTAAIGGAVKHIGDVKEAERQARLEATRQRQALELKVKELEFQNKLARLRQIQEEKAAMAEAEEAEMSARVRADIENGARRRILEAAQEESRRQLAEDIKQISAAVEYQNRLQQATIIQQSLNQFHQSQQQIYAQPAYEPPAYRPSTSYTDCGKNYLSGGVSCRTNSY